mmetsp:Transcript_23067/g.22468  ORF Transcript_23067/g.22468 Transcript_23067/m.22468 type:complete len:85 (-) Transcript_23067:2747-3001(-)
MVLNSIHQSLHSELTRLQLVAFLLAGVHIFEMRVHLVLAVGADVFPFEPLQDAARVKPMEAGKDHVGFIDGVAFHADGACFVLL